jgi:hypothetical protein
VVGSALSNKAIPLCDLQVDNTQPVIIVLGNEGHGIRTNVLMRCDTLVKLGHGLSFGDDSASNATTTTTTESSSSSTEDDSSDSVDAHTHTDTDTDGAAAVTSRGSDGGLEGGDGGDAPGVDSLNVSVAGGILMYHLLGHRRV